MKNAIALLMALAGIAKADELVFVGISTNYTPVAGDILLHNGTNWTLLPKGTNAQVLTIDGGSVAWANAGSGSGAVSNQVANTIFAGPTTGADASPTFRALVAADIPSTQATDSELTAAIAAAGANYQPTNGALTSLGNISTNGALFRIASGSLVSRLIRAGTGVSVSNGDGVSGDVTISADSSMATDAEVTAALASFLTWTNIWTGPQTFSGGVTIPSLTVTNIVVDTLTLSFASTAVEANSSSNLVALSSTGTGAMVRSNAPSITSPALSGTPTAPTQSGGTSNTTVATTAFVASGFQPLDSDLTALAGGTAMATAITNSASVGAPTQYVGATNIASALAAKKPLSTTKYLQLIHPSYGDGAGALPQTNNYTASGLMHYTFSGSAETNVNFVIYEFVVPEDLDTSVAMTAKFSFVGGGTDTDPLEWRLTYGLGSDSAAWPTAVASAPIAWTMTPSSPASGDLFVSSSITLTNWAGSMTAGTPIAVRLARVNNSADDTAREVSLVISYGSNQ